MQLDPAEALRETDLALIEARSSSFLGTENLCDLLGLRLRAAEAAGDAEVADRTRAELLEVVAIAVAEQDRALAEATSATKIATALLTKARYFDRVHRTVEADRLRLQAADVNLAAVGDEGAQAAVAAAHLSVASRGSVALSGAAFQQGWDSNYRGIAEMLRNELLAAGRAVALAHCERCGEVVEADPKRRRCIRGHKVGAVRVVVSEDEQALRAELGSAVTA